MGAPVRLALMVLAAAAAIADPAVAQSPACVDLRSQYLALLKFTDTANTGRAMLEMDQVSRDLAKAQLAAQQGNCSRFLFFGPKPTPQCPAIMGAIARLQQQLARMRGQQGFGLFGRSPEFEKARLRDWMEQYGCDVPGLGGLRTICVRNCDGYYFPISFSTDREQFDKDAAVCQATYGGAGQAELFSYPTNTDVADAVSMGGLRYGDQPYALLYRQQFEPWCAAQLQQGVAMLGERYWASRGQIPGSAVASLVATVPTPNLRPVDRQEDPETIANRAGSLPVAPYADPRETEVAAASTAVRQVGDPYYAELFDPSREAEPPRHRPPLGFDLIGQAMAMEARQPAAPAPVDPAATTEAK